MGSVAGSFTPNVWAASAAGVASHFVLDYIPHWDPIVNGQIPRGRKVLYALLLLSDILLSVVVLVWVYQYPIMFWGGVAGAVVDIDNFLQYWFPNTFPILYQVFKIDAHQEGSKWHKMTNAWLGLFNQGWVTVIGLLVLYLELLNA